MHSLSEHQVGVNFWGYCKSVFALVRTIFPFILDDALWAFGKFKWGGCLTLECSLGLLTYGVDSLVNLLTNPLGVDNGEVSC